MSVERYHGLCAGVVEACLLIASDPLVADAPGAARYVHERAVEVALREDVSAPPEVSVAVEAMDLVAENWPALHEGSLSGLELFRRHPGLWKRLMSEWPMGEYGDLVARYVREVSGPDVDLLELGAGVGHTTRQVPRSCYRTRRVTDLLYAGEDRLDFDAPLTPVYGADAFDLVYATNALHCARDPRATLCWIYEVLRPGGWVVLGEGHPVPDGEPWCLDPLFGVLDGWWDRGGFYAPEYWTATLSEAGFGVVSREMIGTQACDLGGIYYATKLP